MMQSRTQSPTFNISMASVLTNCNSQSFKNRNKVDKSSSPPSTRSTTSNTTCTDTTSTGTPPNIRGAGSPCKREKGAALNHVIPHDTKTWVTLCRKMLIDMESKNIQTRAVFWTQFVNETTSSTMAKIEGILEQLHIDCSEYPKFQFTVSDPMVHLRFLSEWTGLKTQQMQYMPKSYTEFEYKAKNWLNGRKAPNYALTLFPEMIHRSEAYAEQYSKDVFSSNKGASDLLSTALRYGYLAKLCSAKISLNDTGRKTPLLIENSIKTAKSTTSKIFQQYAIDHPYSQQFPTHTSEAATYFEGKHKDCLKSLVMLIKSNGNGDGGIKSSDGKTLASFPTVPMPPIPPIPHIPTLSDASSADTDSNHMSRNSCTSNSLITPPQQGPPQGAFQFSSDQKFSIQNLKPGAPPPSNGQSTPGSTNTTNSTFTGSGIGEFNGNQSHSSGDNNNGTNPILPSIPSIPSMNGLPPMTPNGFPSGNVVLSSGQYHHLVQQLDRLTHTQKEQKNTIHHLVSRLHSLEQVIDSQRALINQFPVNPVPNPNRSMDHFWNNGMNHMQSHPNQTPSVGYSLAHDFAMHSNNSTPNLSNLGHQNTSNISGASSATMLKHSPRGGFNPLHDHSSRGSNMQHPMDTALEDTDMAMHSIPNDNSFPSGNLFESGHDDIAMNLSSEPNNASFPPFI